MCWGHFSRAVIWLLSDLPYIGRIVRFLCPPEPRKRESRKDSSGDEGYSEDEVISRYKINPTVSKTRDILNRMNTNFNYPHLDEYAPGPSKNPTSFPAPRSLSRLSTQKDQANVSDLSFGAAIERVRSQEDIRIDQNEMNRSLRREKNEKMNRKKLEEQKREHDEKCRKLNEEIKECRQETQRLIQERIRYLEMCRQASHVCFLAEKQFKLKEEEWSNYLKIMQNAIWNLKNQAKLLVKVYPQLNPADDNYEEIMVNELNHLHKATLQVNDQVYNECLATKQLAETYPDRLFLRILWKKLTDVQAKLIEILNRIDISKRSKSSVDEIIELFKQLNPRDIPGTDQLRSLEKTETPENYQNIEDPEYYGEP